MSRSRLRAKGRREAGRFAQIPDNVLRSAGFQSLPGGAIRLLLALAAQYNGHNNGDLSAAMTVVRPYGFRSDDTLSNAVAALCQAQLIVRTRSHCRTRDGRRCALYALSWKSINDCPGKGLEVRPTKTPPHTFRPAEFAKDLLRKSEHLPPKTGALWPQQEQERSENQSATGTFQ